MNKLKSHKTVEQIAKKHRLEPSFIKKQLAMGIPIEHEHTKDNDLATDIALQHLDEIPDYYTRLKKMESEAKKEHKKFKDVKEDNEVALGDVDRPIHMPPIHGVHVDYEKRYCPKCKKSELRSECRYGTKYWDLFSLPEKLKEENKSKLVDKILSEIKNENRCWNGYVQRGMKDKNGRKVPNCIPSKTVKKENISIEDANGNTFAEVIDLIKPEPIKGFKSQIDEVTRIKAQTGNVLSIVLSWRGKYYSLKMFFPQLKFPSKKEINTELQKVYPGSVVVHHSISDLDIGKPFIQTFQPSGGNTGSFGPNKKYVKPYGEQFEVNESKKSEMPCNKPKAEAHGSGETGKSHVVKACSGSKEKLIRFGQLGVKGSPKKDGESKEYASRRHRFQARHAKNISKGKMSAAYWANRVKW